LPSSGRSIRIGALVAGVLVLAALIGYFFLNRGRAQPGVPIGVILPLSGDAAAYGTSMKRGMDLAARQ